jgi:hypothetical protein
MDKQEILKRIEKRTTVNKETDCWLYESVDSSGYGEIKLSKDHREKTHRLSAWIFLGLDLDGKLQANHQIFCKNRNCWNPNHLYVGTQEENYIDEYLSGSRTPVGMKIQCINGHEYTEENTAYNKKGVKYCRTCHREAGKRDYQRRFHP